MQSIRNASTVPTLLCIAFRHTTIYRVTSSTEQQARTDPRPTPLRFANFELDEGPHGDNAVATDTRIFLRLTVQDLINRGLATNRDDHAAIDYGLKLASTGASHRRNIADTEVRIIHILQIHRHRRREGYVLRNGIRRVQRPLPRVQHLRAACAFVMPAPKGLRFVHALLAAPERAHIPLTAARPIAEWLIFVGSVETAFIRRLFRPRPPRVFDRNQIVAHVTVIAVFGAIRSACVNECDAGAGSKILLSGGKGRVLCANGQRAVAAGLQVDHRMVAVMEIDLRVDVVHAVAQACVVGVGVYVVGSSETSVGKFRFGQLAK